MSHLEIPRFPRGFLLSERPVDPPPTFVPGPLLPHFWVHPWTNVETAGDLELFVIILGHAVPTGPQQGSDAATALLSALEDGESAFFQAVSAYSGRHAIIFGSAGDLRVVNDATGMRAVYYATDGGVVASHAQLVEQALGGQIEVSELPFRYGYPGNRTPYTRTRILTPNTYYWMTAHLIRRFWPVTAPTQTTTEAAAAHLLDSSTYALRAMAQDRGVRVTLTAGLDSRAILAIALNAGIEFSTYTYGDETASEVDRSVAADLADTYGIAHTTVDQPVTSQVLQDRLEESHYAFHHAGWVGALREHFQDPTELALIGNLLEIGRSNYMPARKKQVNPPTTAGRMLALHNRKVGDNVNRKIRKYGRERYREETRAGFQGFIDDTGFDIVAGLLDPFDQFYWEHRMGTWQGVAMGERDFYAEPFIPFNARTVFATMLGVPEAQRRTDATVLEMIRMVDPGLLDMPVNPTSWPGRVTAGK